MQHTQLSPERRGSCRTNDYGHTPLGRVGHSREIIDGNFG
jgi:hypothetical protein